MNVRWIQPAGSAPVDFWNVYRDGELVLWGVDEVDDAGIYSTRLPEWPVVATYEMTAVNAAGESPRSNAIELVEPSTVLGLLALVPLLWLRRR